MEDMSKKLTELGFLNAQLQMSLEEKTMQEKNLQKKFSSLEKKYETVQESVSNLFNEDQIRVLSGASHRGKPWSNETITKALYLRFSCGSSGNERLLNQVD